ncbi:mucin-5AC isoform X2 [Ochlerotatus camptorhynchus]
MSPKTSSESGATSTAASSRGNSEPVRSPEPGADGLRQRNITGGQSSNAAPTMNTSPISPASADYIMGQHLAMQNWMQQAYMQYLNQYMNVISNGQNPQSLYASAPTNLTNSNIPQPSPQAAALATPAIQNPILAQTLPNLAYYPYLSTMNSSPMPSASSIPAPITSSGPIPTSPTSSVDSVTAGPSSQPTIPSSASSSPTTASSVVPGTSPASSPSSSTVNAASTATAAAAAVEDTSAQAQQAPVADAAPAAAAAPARRFPNIVVEEQENRDWLDIFFSMCRVGILMTVVYLYSSPTRCLTVFLIGISLYLYQIGFFRNTNTDRLERARRMVVQQMNNAHGIRPNVAGLRARAPVAPAAAEPAANAQAPATPQPTASTATVAAKADADTTDGAKSAESSSSTEIRNSASTQDSPVEETLSTAVVESNAEEQPADPSEIVPEANRVNLNDVAAFLRTLVLSFFTSIIPDMPAA